MFVDHDGTDTYRSDFFFDNSTLGYSPKFIGTFTSNIASGVLKLNFENTESNNVLVRSRIVGFNTVGAGIGTHILKQVVNQTVLSEKVVLKQILHILRNWNFYSIDL